MGSRYGLSDVTVFVIFLVPPHPIPLFSLRASPVVCVHVLRGILWSGLAEQLWSGIPECVARFVVRFVPAMRVFGCSVIMDRVVKAPK